MNLVLPFARCGNENWEACAGEAAVKMPSRTTVVLLSRPGHPCLSVVWSVSVSCFGCSVALVFVVCVMVRRFVRPKVVTLSNDHQRVVVISE